MRNCFEVAKVLQTALLCEAVAWHGSRFRRVSLSTLDFAVEISIHFKSSFRDENAILGCNV